MQSATGASTSAPARSALHSSKGLAAAPRACPASILRQQRLVASVATVSSFAPVLVGRSADAEDASTSSRSTSAFSTTSRAWLKRVAHVLASE